MHSGKYYIFALNLKQSSLHELPKILLWQTNLVLALCLYNVKKTNSS